MLFSNKCPLGLLTLFFSRHAQEKVRQAYLSLQTEKTRFLEVDNTKTHKIIELVMYHGQLMTLYNDW